jgi:hypothetical protein
VALKRCGSSGILPWQQRCVHDESEIKTQKLSDPK